MIGVTSRGTARHGVRVDDELWAAFGEVAEQLGTDRSVLLREYMAWAARRLDAPAPRRAPPDPR